MANETPDFDAVVVGAGSTGAAAASALSRAGLRVALLEQRSSRVAGARWINAIPEWLFGRAGLARPAAAEMAGDAHPFRMSFERCGVGIPALPWLHVDMRALVDRLQQEARTAGATIVDHVRDVRVAIDRRGRPEALEFGVADAGAEPRRRTVRARLFVDATGVAGALRRQVPDLDRACPSPGPRDLCAAAQWNCGIADTAGAEAFLGRHGAGPGTTVARMGRHGGYSTLMIGVDARSTRVNLLAGALADGLHPGGVEQLRSFRRENPWVGPLAFGGAGLIPLRRPFDLLVAPGIALLGDAACQVFPAHGSGVGAGLVAARLLADAVGRAPDPGDVEALWGYASAFHREFGAVWALYDAFRRFSMGLAPSDLDALAEAGLMTPRTVEAAMSQRPYVPSPADLPAAARMARTSPAVLGRFAIWGAAMGAAWTLYRLYPSSPDRTALRRWSWAVSRVFGGAPDVST